MGDTQPIKEYFDVHGRPGVSIRDVERGPNGEIAVHFGEGKTAAFENAQDAIQKLLVPAAATMAMQAGGGKAGVKGSEGGLSAEDVAGVRSKAFEFGHDPLSAGEGSPEEKARKYEQYVLGGQGQAPPQQPWRPEFPTRTLRNKKTGEVITVPDNKINRPYMEGKDPETGEETRWTYRDGKVIKEPKKRKGPARGVKREEPKPKPAEKKSGFRGTGASGSWGDEKEEKPKGIAVPERRGSKKTPESGAGKKKAVTYGDLYNKAAEAVESFDPRMSEKEKKVLKGKIEKLIDPSKNGNITISVTTEDVKKLARNIGMKTKDLAMFVPYLFERLAETPISS